MLGFHAQQAVEKALKAVLSGAGQAYPRTHNLVMLLELLRTVEIEAPPDADSFAHLTPYGVVLRYEGWFKWWPCSTLLVMPKRSLQRGRPTGTTTYEAEPAIAFGAAVREERTNQGIAQETRAHMAGIERSHTGKIERSEHVPTLPLILKIARALKCSSAHLMTMTEAKLEESALSAD